MVCPECSRLRKKFEVLERFYVAAFGAMIAASASTTTVFVRLKIAASDAWIEAEAARLELDQHKRRHSFDERGE
jgi:hypothetical protein